MGRARWFWLLVLLTLLAPTATEAVTYADRVYETTTTTGTGTVNLDGAVTKYRTFVDGIGDGNEVYYCIVHRTAAEWECGIGTVTDASPDTLARDTLASSSTGSPVSFSAGTKDVFAGPLASFYTEAVRAPSALSSNTLVKASGDRSLTPSCISDDGTAATVSCTGGISAPAFSTSGSGAGTIDLLCNSAPSASATDHAKLYCNATSDTLLVSLNSGSYAKVLTNPASLSAEVTGTLPVANGGTNLTAATDDNVMVGNGTTWQSKALPSCSASDSALTYNTSTNALGCNTISGGGGSSPVSVVHLGSDATANATTTGVEITGLQKSSTGTGTFVFQYFLLVQTSITTTGVKFGVNHTGTATIVANLRYQGVGGAANASSQAISSPTSVGGASTRTASTTAPNLGPTISLDATSSNVLHVVEGIVIVTGDGDLELWHASETAASTQVMAGSSLVLTKTN